MERSIRAWLFLPLIFGFLLLSPNSQKGLALAAQTIPTPWVFHYHDGSGNGFRFWQDSPQAEILFETSPIRPENSSSGAYSGGEAKKGRIAAEDMNQLWNSALKLEKESSLHSESRQMGTGAFSLKKGNESQEFIIKAGDSLQEFNALLAKTLNRSKSESKPASLDSPEAPFPLFPGAKFEAKGATSLQTGQNYIFSVYNVDKPKEEVLRFYETHLSQGYQRAEASDGSVKFSFSRGSLRVSGSGNRTRIEITQGPL